MLFVTLVLFSYNMGAWYQNINNYGTWQSDQYDATEDDDQSILWLHWVVILQNP
jgi:hypothetical protein